MKSFNINYLEDKKCPMCNGQLECMKFSGMVCIEQGNGNHSASFAGLDQIFLSSADPTSKHHKSGEFYLCNTCGEVMYLYSESDCRECGQCQHYKPLPRVDEKGNLNNRYGCAWYDITIDEVKSYGDYDKIRSHRVCRHVDEDPKPVDPKMKCWLCVHYDKHKDRYSDIEIVSCGNVGCPFTREGWGRHSFENRKQVCMDFIPSYEKYKEYRASFDDMLIIPDDAIRIPAFDKMIEEERKKENA
jgi:hypothetical protein